MTRTLEVRTLREGEAEEAIAFLQRDALAFGPKPEQLIAQAAGLLRPRR